MHSSLSRTDYGAVTTMHEGSLPFVTPSSPYNPMADVLDQALHLTGHIVTEEHRVEIEKCSGDYLYFIDNYIHIENATLKKWIPFKLWDYQRDFITAIHTHQRNIVLKARQLGISWCFQADDLWAMLFEPGTVILLFSKGEDEAKELIKRLYGMYQRLPQFLKLSPVSVKNTSTLGLANGSSAKAFPSTGADSYTGSRLRFDEFDLLDNQESLLTSSTPAIDAGGNLLIVSRPDKKKPSSSFKRTYRDATKGLNSYNPIFYPWFAPPNRDDAWYERVKGDILSTTGSIDGVHEQYPANEVEALSANSMDKRIPELWLFECFEEKTPLNKLDDYEDTVTYGRSMLAQAPPIPGLLIYKLPVEGMPVFCGADPAEGNPTSDDSTAVFMNLDGEEVAYLSGKIQPTVFSSYIAQILRYYNGTNSGRVMPERNNHGHAVIQALEDEDHVKVMRGRDAKKGWLSSSLGKTIMYNIAADTFRRRDCKIHTQRVYDQLASIEGGTLRAPKQQHDDDADGYSLALVARQKLLGRSVNSKVITDIVNYDGR